MSYRKYRAIPTVIDGIRFASRKEAARYRDLCLLVKVGQIVNLKRQVKFPLVVNDCHVGNYVADFTYQTAAGETIIEDVKGMRAGVPYTLFTLKKRLLEATTGLQVREV